MCRVLSYPFLAHKYADSMNEKKFRDSYASFPARLLEQRGNLPNINHSTWRKSQEIENPSAKYADRLDFIELFDRCPRQFKI